MSFARFIRFFRAPKRKIGWDLLLLARVLLLAIFGGWLVYGYVFYAGYFQEIDFAGLQAFSERDIRWNWTWRLLSDWLLYYVIAVSWIVHFVSFRRVRITHATVAAMVLVFLAVLSDVIRDISQEGWSGDVDWDLYLQMVCWFGAISAVLTSANPRLSLKSAIAVTVLSSVPFFFYGSYTMRLVSGPEPEPSKLQLLEEKESRPIYLVFVGERGILYLTRKSEADSSKTESRTDDTLAREGSPANNRKFRIEFSPYSSIKLLSIASYEKGRIFEKTLSMSIALRDKVWDLGNRLLQWTGLASPAVTDKDKQQ